MRVKRSLYGKFVAGLIVVLLLIGVLYAVFTSVLSSHLRQTATQTLNRDLAQNLVDDRRIVANGEVDEKALKETFMAYMSINPSIEIYYLSSAGDIMSYSAEPGVVKRKSVDLDPIKAFIAGEPEFPLYGDDPRSHDKQKPFSVTQLPNALNPTGYLYIVLQGQEYNNAMTALNQRYGLSLSVFAVFASLLLGMLAGLWIFKRLSARIVGLQEKVTAFAEGDFVEPNLVDQDAILALQQGDEIDELEARFQQMRHHIADQWAALSQKDRLRREMVATISHDLRTPLASALGYLETIKLKFESISEEDRQRYLDISIKQTKRIQDLIDQLFELVKLEARDINVNFENFSILELIYDVVGKFALRAETENVSLQVDPGAIDAQVVADVGLIERVLDNLIANGLHYVPAGCNIWVHVEATEDSEIRVSVSDDGNGISSNQQELIFERFHRADNPQRSSTGHAGLGLAIVKKILELHEQRVWVESQPGRGASFFFTLNGRSHSMQSVL